MKKKRSEKQLKRPYRKPELMKVLLRPEEAVLGNCKTSGVSGPVQADCTTAGGCSSDGT
jgi:hypothetical protein